MITNNFSSILTFDTLEEYEIVSSKLDDLLSNPDIGMFDVIKDSVNKQLSFKISLTYKI